MVAMKKLLIFAAAATMFAACSKDTTQDLAIDNQIDKLYVSISDDDSRVQLNNECKTVWNEGDEVAVYNGSDSNRNNWHGRYKFDGNTGDTKGTLSFVSGEYQYCPDGVFAVYPYSASVGYCYGSSSYWRIISQNTQYYEKNSYGKGANIMIAQSNDTENLMFYNLLGYIKLQLSGSGTVSSIVLSGNNKECIIGELHLSKFKPSQLFYDDYLIYELNNNDIHYYVCRSTNIGPSYSTYTSVTLACNNGAELSETNPTSFYLGVIPQTFTDGITVTINFSDGSQMIKSTSNKITVLRNHIQPLSSIVCQSQNITIPNNEIWYTSVNNRIVSPNDRSCRNETVNFGANIISNTYSNGKGIIKFDGDIRIIDANAFSNEINQKSAYYLTSITIPNSVTEIGDNAFYECANLMSINIPDEVAYIGKSAFYGCKVLSSVKIPDSVRKINNQVFQGCSNLTDITISNNIISIGEYAFYGCSKLTEINIPNKVITIGNRAFSNCTNLRNITISDNLSSLGNFAFENCVSLNSISFPNSLTDAGNGILSGCNNLSQITGKFASSDNRCLIINGKLDAFARDGILTYNIPNNATSISEYAFAGCKNLQSITIHDSVTEISDGAFQDCSGLSSIVIGKGLKIIPESAFDGCSSLKTLNIPEGVTSIRSNAFNGCYSLNTTTIPKTVTYFGKTPFAGCTGKVTCNCNLTGKVLSSGNAAFANSMFTEFIIGDDVTQISSAFAICIDSLTSLTIGKNVVTIEPGCINSKSLKSIYGKYASNDNRCIIINNTLVAFAPYGLKAYSIPEGVVTISRHTFYSNKTLRSLTIPKSVTDIGTQALSSTSIEEIYCMPTIPPTISSSSFDYTDCIIYVPKNSVSAYKADSYWSKQTIVGF